MPRPDVKFCRLCGTAMTTTIPPMEDRERATCPSCGYIDYLNPINVVGTVTTHGEGDELRILLCRRNIEPRKGFWTLPAGFLELDESVVEGAARETREEAGVNPRMGELFTVIDAVRPGQVHLFFRATADTLEVDPGPETIECWWVQPEEIPWEELSFQTVQLTLRHWVDDHAAGEFTLHHEVVGRMLP
ncbi:NUDIX hydrolase [Calidifontibacter sp. DB0510]|uniref:NUDIX hydrolase n=1 Tax=Metallococcus carri TaxID=1656884 RepID=A0A967B2Y7_9MICO|nr:NUDIX hydrolase [Metallococcus carri]NHN54687.1 NUDIX hydrolase [Metallococcus carri]NOP37032.1 NUDIX hydrolase [Calidifontibacter sp. DB2511S]